MPNPTIGSRESRGSGARRPEASRGSTVDPLELARWLEDRSDEIGERWLSELHSRGGGAGAEELEDVVAAFVGLFTRLLPGLMGPLKEQVEPLWTQTAELYGNTGALRGLASGEAIEEFQVFREVLIRQIYHDPPGGPGRSLDLRELLALNRVVDQGVTHASVGHTDSLFFALFQGGGVSERPTPEVVEGVRDQVEMIHNELEKLGPLI